MTLSANGVTITDAALTQLVTHAAEQVDGVRVRRRSVEVGTDTAALGLSARYGDVLPDVARSVQESVAAAFRAMCGSELRAVDVTVEDVE